MPGPASGIDLESRIIPVFPLPNTVLFPRTFLPLHIFEPRYRVMILDVTEGDGLLVVSRKVGRDFEEIGTVGRVSDLTTLDDGRFNLVLEGLERVSMDEVECDTPYRQVRIEPRPEHPGAEDPGVLEQSKLELLATLTLLLSTARPGLPVVLDQRSPFEVLLNDACSSLPIEAPLRQRLLAADDLLARQRELLLYLDRVIETISEPGAEGPGTSPAPN
jgi:Lon protease-like protein